MDTFTQLNSSLFSGFSFYEKTQSSDLIAQSANTTTPISVDVVSESSKNQSMHATAGSKQMLLYDDAFDTDSSIQTFLARKVKLTSFSWEVGTLLGQSFDPWKLWMQKPAIAHKLNNFYLLKGNLELTFYINGTPFHYGMACADFNYYDRGRISTSTSMNAATQRPHIFLNPTTNKGGTMTIPFFHPFNYIGLVNPEPTLEDMGSLRINSFSELGQINAGTAEVQISVFAQLKDMKLSIPTTYESLYSPTGSGDLVAMSMPVSSNNHQDLKGVPPFRNTPFSNMATIDQADNSQRLTLSNNTTVCSDEYTSGAPPDDVTSIESFTKRETFVDKFTWSPSATPTTMLFNFQVTPCMEFRFPFTQASVVIGDGHSTTSLSFISKFFTEWSGSLKYRFQFLASQFHRGRIAIVYDPVGIASADPFHTNYHTIIDLEESHDFTIEVPYTQDVPYCRMLNKGVHEFYSAVTPLSSLPQVTNGVLSMVVLNGLSVPDGTSPVECLVSISAGDDFELRNIDGNFSEFSVFSPKLADSPDFALNSAPENAPSAGVVLSEGKATTKVTKKSRNKSDLVAQSGEVDDPTAVEVVPGEENAPESELLTVELAPAIKSSPGAKYWTYYGEYPTDIYQMCKRFTYFRTLTTEQFDPPKYGVFRYKLQAMPPTLGYDPNGPDLVAKSGPGDYNFTAGQESLVGMFKNVFCGWRGSMRWKFVSILPSEQMTVTRVTGDDRFQVTNYRGFRVTDYAFIEKPGAVAYAHSYKNSRSGSGMVLTPTKNMNSLEVEIPYTFPFRFSRTTESEFSVDGDRQYPSGPRFEFTITTDAAGEHLVDTFVSVGDDFRFFGYVGSPLLYTNFNPASNETPIN